MSLFREELIKDLKSSATLLTKAALAIPKDKLEWTPGGKARSTISILQECAGFPQWLMFAIENRRMPTEDEARGWQNTLLKEANSVEAITDILNKETNKLCSFFEKYPDSKLTDQMTFPWGTYTMAGTFGFHYWNNSYHLGQINYLQLILGDTEMHM